MESIEKVTVWERVVKVSTVGQIVTEEIILEKRLT